MDVAESGSNGELLRYGRQLLQHLYTSSELFLADAAVINAVLHTTHNAKHCVASRLARATDPVERHHRDVCMTPNLRSLHWLRTVWIRLPDTSPSTTTQNRSCETLSPAASGLVSITRAISNCWAEEKCDITDDLLTHERTTKPLKFRPSLSPGGRPDAHDRHGTPWHTYVHAGLSASEPKLSLQLGKRRLPYRG